MVVEDIPDWAKDENDPPKKMWEKKEVKEEDSEEIPKDDAEETEEVLEDDKDHGTGPFVEGLYNATEETDDDEESEDDPEEGDEDEDMGEPIDEDEDEDKEPEEDEDDTEDDEDEETVVEIDPDDDLPPSSDTASLDSLVPVEEDNKDIITTPLNPEKGTDTPTEDENARKKRPKRSFKNWLNGTPENPLPLFSLRAKFKRWRLIKFHNHVWLRIMSYDKNTNEYTICENLIPKSKLPKTAVHCTNEKHVWFDKLFEVPYEPWKDNGFGAMNAYLYMKDTSIDEALLLLWQGPKMNMRTVAIVGIVAVAAIFYIFYMMQG